MSTAVDKAVDTLRKGVVTDPSVPVCPAPSGLLIIWHSRTGAARAMALAGLAGATCDTDHEQDAPRATMIAADAAGPADMVAAAGYLFVCPENLGSMSGEMKAFFDRCYYPVLDRIEGRAFATAIAAGNAGQGAETQIERIVRGWRLKRVAPSLIVRLNAQTPAAINAPKTVLADDLRKCRDLGRALAMGLHLNMF